MAPRFNRTGYGGTLAGFLAGLALGLVLAAGAALLVTRAPVPFVNKVARPDRVTEPKAAAELPDPNHPSRRAPGASEPETASSRPESASPGVLERLFGSEGSSTSPEASAHGEVRPAEGTRSELPAVARITPEAGVRSDERSLFLQAGAFRSPEDAEAMKGRLALAGFEARVSSVEVNGQTLHRVRLGPFAHMDDVNKARSRLADNGIDASVVRQN